MNAYYVDESGSMTKMGLDLKLNKYFIICLVLTSDNKKLERIYKRFVSSNINELRRIDVKGKMFYGNGKFKELKGSAFTPNMKRKFIDFFCQNNLFSIYYICSNNVRAEDYFYSNTARAFNYLIKLSIEYNTKVNNIPKSVNYCYIDERNVKTNTRSTLCEYLNTELVTAQHLQSTFMIEYCQSESKSLIQVADVFSNIYFSYLYSSNTYDIYIENMRKNMYIKNEFFFPIK